VCCWAPAASRLRPSAIGNLLNWAGGLGAIRRAGAEWTGSNGAALARHQSANHIEVIEVNQPDKAGQRRRGETDTVDAEAAARAMLSGRANATAKAGDGPVEYVARELYRLITPPTEPQRRTGPLDIHSGIKRDYTFRGTIDVASIRIWLRDPVP
jgi:hypothetical protein